MLASPLLPVPDSHGLSHGLSAILIYTFLIIRETQHLFCCFVFQDRVSLCSPGFPGTHSVDQTDLELRDLPASASLVLCLIKVGIEGSTSMAPLRFSILNIDGHLEFLMTTCFSLPIFSLTAAL